jgi:hypothetical protein
VLRKKYSVEGDALTRTCAGNRVESESRSADGTGLSA